MLDKHMDEQEEIRRAKHMDEQEQIMRAKLMDEQFGEQEDSEYSEGEMQTRLKLIA